MERRLERTVLLEQPLLRLEGTAEALVLELGGEGVALPSGGVRTLIRHLEAWLGDVRPDNMAFYTAVLEAVQAMEEPLPANRMAAERRLTWATTHLRRVVDMAQQTIPADWTRPKQVAERLRSQLQYNAGLEDSGRNARACLVILRDAVTAVADDLDPLPEDELAQVINESVLAANENMPHVMARRIAEDAAARLRERGVELP